MKTTIGEQYDIYLQELSDVTITLDILESPGGEHNPEKYASITKTPGAPDNRLIVKQSITKITKALTAIKEQEEREELYYVLSGNKSKIKASIERYKELYINKLEFLYSTQKANQDNAIHVGAVEPLSKRLLKNMLSNEATKCSPFIRSQLAHAYPYSFVGFGNRFLRHYNIGDNTPIKERHKAEKTLISSEITNIEKVPMSLWHQLGYGEKQTTHRKFISETDEAVLLEAISYFKKVKATIEPLEMTGLPTSWKIGYISFPGKNKGDIVIYRHDTQTTNGEVIEKEFMSIHNSIFDAQRSQEKITKKSKKRTSILQGIGSKINLFLEQMALGTQAPSKEEILSVLKPIQFQKNKQAKMIYRLTEEYDKTTHTGIKKQKLEKIVRTLEERITTINGQSGAINKLIDAFISKNNKAKASRTTSYKHIRENLSIESIKAYSEKIQGSQLINPYAQYGEEFLDLKESVGIHKNTLPLFDTLLSIHGLHYRLETMLHKIISSSILEKEGIVGVTKRITALTICTSATHIKEHAIQSSPLKKVIASIDEFSGILLSEQEKYSNPEQLSDKEVERIIDLLKSSIDTIKVAIDEAKTQFAPQAS